VYTIYPHGLTFCRRFLFFFFSFIQVKEKKILVLFEGYVSALWVFRSIVCIAQLVYPTFLLCLRMRMLIQIQVSPLVDANQWNMSKATAAATSSSFKISTVGTSRPVDQSMNYSCLYFIQQNLLLLLLLNMLHACIHIWRTWEDERNER
jgi:hypothetical protein